jgi:hypothetical protein
MRDDLDTATTLVGNALTALDDPAGLPDLDGDPIEYAKANLSAALTILEPDTYE